MDFLFTLHFHPLSSIHGLTMVHFFLLVFLGFTQPGTSGTDSYPSVILYFFLDKTIHHTRIHNIPYSVVFILPNQSAEQLYDSIHSFLWWGRVGDCII